MRIEPDFPFKSDGCTWFPDLCYGDCCVEHDRAYHMGGTRKGRREADVALRRCVASSGPSLFMPLMFLLAWLMYLGVRIGGVTWIPFGWQWGFGWEDSGYWENETTYVVPESAESDWEFVDTHLTRFLGKADDVMLYALGDEDVTMILLHDGGMFVYDPTDLTSPHDGVNMLVSLDFRRYRRRIRDERRPGDGDTSPAT